jgi:hypothetical protein
LHKVSSVVYSTYPVLDFGLLYSPELAALLHFEFDDRVVVHGE